MADVYVTNFALQAANHAFSAVWKLSRAMKKAGWTYKSSGDGTAKDTTGTASNDKWGGNADPIADSYPTALDSVAAWWNARGPTVLKLSMTSAPSGTFVRGEKVTQTTSGAEGELVGYDFDNVSVGHAVIIPRTGTFDGTNVITGATSGATFTATAVETFVCEVVLFKSTNLVTGSIYMQRVSNENENASRFSVLAGSAGCTATVAPGGGGTGNTFPAAGSYVACGTQTGTPAHSNWFQVSTNLGKAQLVATNNTGAAGVSPDGTFWGFIGDTSSSTQAEFFGYYRCDDTEDGDLDPFIFQKVTGVASNNANARLDGSGTTACNTTNVLGSAAVGGSMTWKGWRRRGFATNDAFQAYAIGALWGGSGGTPQFLNDNGANPETMASSYTTKRVRDKLALVSQDNTKKGRKGSPRWLWLMQGQTTFDTLDSKLKLIATSANPTIVIGPYDGTTTPAQA